MFNGWLFENYEDAKTAIVGSILDELEEDVKGIDKAKKILKGLYKSIDKFKLVKNGLRMGTEFALTGGIGVFADLTVNSILKAIPSLADDEEKFSKIKQSVEQEFDNKALRDDIHKFQKDFEELIKESKISKLVVFIDELDRCRPDTILDTLEAIKLFLFTGKVAFVIGADERHIAYAVKTKFKDIEGIQIDIGKEYLEKLVQYPVRIPRMNSTEVETYISCLLLQNELDEDLFERVLNEITAKKYENFLDFDILETVKSLTIDSDLMSKIIDSISVARQLSDVLSSGLHGNPRQCKRFLNSLYMRLNMATYRNIKLDRKVLAKIMLLEYIKPVLFNEFAKRTFNNTLLEELKNAEDKGISDDSEFLKRWKDDKWVINWLTMEPHLSSNDDLKMYFYFSRTSLDERISRISATLSPEAQSVFDG